MAARNYSSVARQTTLTSGVSGVSTVFPVTETTGFPSVPYTMVVDPGRSGEEAVLVVTQIGLSLTVERGQDGTAAQPHDAGATLRHMATAQDFREPAEHIAATENTHGIFTAFVGETDTQTLDNKTFLAGITNHTAVTFQAATGQSAPVVRFSSPADVTTAYFSTAGRLSSPGVDGTDSTTLTAGASGTVPLIVKGAASQSAKLLSVRDSGNTEKVSADANGLLTAASVSTPILAATDATITTLTSTTTANLTTATNAVPLVVKTAAASTANAVSVQDSTSTPRTGVLGDSSGYQLFQGSATNKVPFRIHGGTQSVTMLSGASSQGGTIDISSFGFTVPPLVYLSVRQDNESSVKRRVFVNMEGAATTSAVSFRVVQSADQNLPDNTNYVVHWMMMQVSPSAASG